QLTLGLLGVHVALDDLALCALELLERHANFLLEPFQLRTNTTRLTAIFLLLLFAASLLRPAFKILRLPIERAHGIDRFVHTFDQTLAFIVGKTEVTHTQTEASNCLLKIVEREIALRARNCPRSMRLAISTSPSRVSNGTVPISRRYMRTGSLVFSSAPGVRSSSTSSPASSSSNFLSRPAPGIFGPSSTSIPCVPIVVSRSSRSSGLCTSCGIRSLTSSYV